MKWLDCSILKYLHVFNYHCWLQSPKVMNRQNFEVYGSDWWKPSISIAGLSQLASINHIQMLSTLSGWYNSVVRTRLQQPDSVLHKRSHSSCKMPPSISFLDENLMSGIAWCHTQNSTIMYRETERGKLVWQKWKGGHVLLLKFVH